MVIYCFKLRRTKDFAQNRKRRLSLPVSVLSWRISVKTELVYQTSVLKRNQAEKEIFEYIESYYNSLRRHSILTYKTPVEYERMKKAA